MLEKKNSEDIPRVLDYIGEDYVQCFYLYMDIIECGVEDDGLGLWVVEEAGKLSCVFYQYYDCLHIFSRDFHNPNEATQLINAINPKVISSSKDIIEQLFDILDKEAYFYELNHIITSNIVLDGGTDVNIEEATQEDIPEIARLMLKAKIYSDVYDYDGLCSSLENRLASGFGRMFIIRDESGRLIATNATNAETDKLAVIGGLVTDPEMRGRGLGSAITASTWNLIKREGKRGTK